MQYVEIELSDLLFHCFSDVTGAYAHFLWENEEDDEDGTARKEDQIEVLA